MPGFNPARKVEVGGQDNNCGLNCLVHVLSTCINTDSVDSKAKNELLAAYKTEYGANYTWGELVTEFSTLIPRQKELRFSPVLRKLYTKAYQAVPDSFKLLRTKGAPRSTLVHNTMVSDEELNILAYCFNINVESYLGDDLEQDLFAARGVQNPLRHNRPAATLKLWAPQTDNTHYSFQLPDSMGLNAYKSACPNATATPARNNSSANANNPFEQKINTLFSAFESMFEKIFPNTSNADANNSWLGSIKSFFSFLAPIFKFFMGFATMFADDEKKTKSNEPAHANAQTNQAQQLAAAQARANTRVNANPQQAPAAQQQVSPAQPPQQQPATPNTNPQQRASASANQQRHR